MPLTSGGPNLSLPQEGLEASDDTTTLGKLYPRRQQRLRHIGTKPDNR
jgi:hypothetical protein